MTEPGPSLILTPRGGGRLRPSAWCGVGDAGVGEGDFSRGCGIRGRIRTTDVRGERDAPRLRAIRDAGDPHRLCARTRGHGSFRQLIRPPGEVLRCPRNATCLDAALVLAAAYELGGPVHAGDHESGRSRRRHTLVIVNGIPGTSRGSYWRSRDSCPFPRKLHFLGWPCSCPSRQRERDVEWGAQRSSNWRSANG